jgi:hypothetical protein
MEKLKFPIIKEKPPSSKSLSMDDYLRFVSLNLKYTFNRQAYQKWKRGSAVKEAFVLK